MSDPRRQAGWWPRVNRVEHLAGRPGAERARWTSIFAADSGRLLRLDYRCTAATRPSRYEWEQELEGTAFEKHLLRQAFRARIEPRGEGSRVSLTTIHSLRGAASLAGFTMKKGQRTLLDSALGFLAELVEQPAGKEGG